MRYQVSGPEDADHTLLLIHGLFVNSDHWRRALTGLGGGGGNDGSSCRIYALDLLGCGWFPRRRARAAHRPTNPSRARSP